MHLLFPGLLPRRETRPAPGPSEASTARRGPVLQVQPGIASAAPKSVTTQPAARAPSRARRPARSRRSMPSAAEARWTAPASEGRSTTLDREPKPVAPELLASPHG